MIKERYGTGKEMSSSVRKEVLLMGGKEIIKYSYREDLQGDYKWPIFVASTSQGLSMLKIGELEGLKEKLFSWVKRWVPEGEVLFECDRFHEDVYAQLEEYFAGKRQEFTLPLDDRGTDFQKRVWEELRKIPYGTTCSYGDIAEKIGNPKGPRAVGLANNRNPIAIITPCHRVVGKSGSLVGYASGLDHKERLLKLEGVNF